MYVGGSGVLPGPVWADVAEVPLQAVVRVQILEVHRLGDTRPRRGFDKLPLKLRWAEGARGNVNGPIRAMDVARTGAVVSFELADQVSRETVDEQCMPYLLHVRQNLLGRPPRHFPGVQILSLRPRVGEHVD